MGVLALVTVRGVYALLAGLVLLTGGWRLRTAHVVVLRLWRRRRDGAAAAAGGLHTDVDNRLATRRVSGR